jgi:hypothetical protein
MLKLSVIEQDLAIDVPPRNLKPPHGRTAHGRGQHEMTKVIGGAVPCSSHPHFRRGKNAGIIDQDAVFRLTIRRMP